MNWNNRFLDSMRVVGDVEADDLIKKIFSTGKASELYQFLAAVDETSSLLVQSEDIRFFMQAIRKKPDWYDRDKVNGGQQFFKKYALDIMTMLGAMSLPYCYAATPGNKAIYLSEKMRKNPGKRLLDTASFIIAVMKTGSLDDGAEGLYHINKTRIIHALVRYMLQTKTDWNLQWGLPVNQEDMAGTNLAFSYIIVLGLMNAKFALERNEVENFLFAWRYIGYHLHIHEDLLPTSYLEAKELERKIRERHFKISNEGNSLTLDLIKHYKESFPAIPAYIVDSQIRYMIGPEISELLGLSPEPVKDAVVKFINRIKEKLNEKYIDPKSYKKMLLNHVDLKRRFS